MESSYHSSRIKHRNWVLNFLPVWIGQLFSLLGSAIVQFSLVWWITTKSGSATALAVASLAGIIPGMLLGPFIGTLIDRNNRKTIMILSDSIMAFCVLILAVLFWVDLVSFWQIYLLMAVRSIAGAFHSSALNASIVFVVPEEHLTRVSGINQGIMSVIGIIAPPLGALLVSMPTLNFGQIMLVDVVSAVIAVLLLVLVIIPQPEKKISNINWHNFMKESKAVFTYVLNHKSLLVILASYLLVFFFYAPVMYLEPAFVYGYLNLGVYEFSVYEITFGIGALISGAIIGAWGGLKNKVITMFLGIFLTGAGLLWHGLLNAQNWWQGGIAFFICGVMIVVINSPFYAILQSRVDPGIQGRMFSLLNSMSGLLSTIALLTVAPIADRFSVQIVFVVSAVLILLIPLLLLRNPTIMNIEEPH